ncbi:MAG: hypothetical protein ACXWQ5_20835 [Ktedonobacterales bacterium]
MKLGFHINDYDWDGGAGRIGPTLAVIGFVPRWTALRRSKSSGAR